MSFLVDTNVMSELRKGGRANAGVLAWFADLPANEIFLSALTVGEIRTGIERVRHRNDVVAARALERWLETLCDDYGGQILPVDRAVAETWGRLNVPNPVPVVDGLLAATALVHGLVVATRNVADVAPTGVECLNPFD